MKDTKEYGAEHGHVSGKWKRNNDKYGRKSLSDRSKKRSEDGNGFKRKRLEKGSSYRDRELGEGIVTAITTESITVRFGDVEKEIPRRRRIERDSGERSFERKPFGKKPFEKRKYAKDDRNPVFKFDTTHDKETERNPGEKRSPVKVGLHVVDDLLGPGVVGRITERGTYVTYERTGEFVLYPSGLPTKLLKSAFPEGNKKREKSMIRRNLKGARTYKISAEPEMKKEEKTEITEITQEFSAPTEKDARNTRYFEISEGTLVSHKEFGEGIITKIENGCFIIDFSGVSKKYPYPESLANGVLAIVEK